MKITKIVLGALTAALALALVACGSASVYTQETLEEADGIKVTAENAGTDQTAITEGAITVKEGDVIVISPCLDQGSFHLTITSQDGKTIAYDDEASGRVLYTIEAQPGVYDVKTSGNDATGWMTVFSSNAEDEAALNASLEEVLAANGIDKGAVSGE